MIQFGDINIAGDIKTYRWQWKDNLQRMDNTRLPLAANYYKFSRREDVG
jgi:hypothetical protein